MYAKIIWALFIIKQTLIYIWQNDDGKACDNESYSSIFSSFAKFFKR